MPKSVMIFAAGKGTRMAPLTDVTPKPMIQVAGKPLAEYAFELAAAENLNVVMNLHYLPESIRAYFAPKGVAFSDEADKLLDTGGGLRRARSILGEDTVFTLNSDAMWCGPNPLSLLRDAWDPEKMDALLLLLPPESVHGRKGNVIGDFSITPSGNLTRGGPLLYSGAQIIKTDRLIDISGDVFSLNLYWNLLMKTNRVFGVSYTGEWCDVGQPSSIPVAEAMLRRYENV